MPTGCSTPSTPPSRAAWGWACRSAVRSPRRTAAASGPRTTAAGVRSSPSRCPIPRGVLLPAPHKRCRWRFDAHLVGKSFFDQKGPHASFRLLVLVLVIVGFVVLDIDSHCVDIITTDLS